MPATHAHGPASQFQDPGLGQEMQPRKEEPPLSDPPAQHRLLLPSRLPATPAAKTFPCIHGINFPKESLSEFDLREPSISRENHQLLACPRDTALFGSSIRKHYLIMSRGTVQGRPAHGACCPLPTSHAFNSLDGVSSERGGGRGSREREGGREVDAESAARSVPDPAADLLVTLSSSLLRVSDRRGTPWLSVFEVLHRSFCPHLGQSASRRPGPRAAAVTTLRGCDSWSVKRGLGCPYVAGLSLGRAWLWAWHADSAPKTLAILLVAVDGQQVRVGMGVPGRGTGLALCPPRAQAQGACPLVPRPLSAASRAQSRQD